MATSPDRNRKGGLTFYLALLSIITTPAPYFEKYFNSPENSLDAVLGQMGRVCFDDVPARTVFKGYHPWRVLQEYVLGF